MNEAVTTLTIDARGAETGSAAYVRAMRAAQAAADRTIDLDRKATEARERGNVVMLRQSDTIARSAQAWDRLRASIDPQIAATKAIEQAQLRADAAVRRGIASQMEADRVVELVRKRYTETTVAVNDNAKALVQLQRQTGLASHEMINLGRQAQDVGTMLAMGASPMQVFTSQAAQIVDIFSSSQGTVSGFFRQMLSGLARVGPYAAVAVAAVTALYSAFSVAGEQQQLSNSLLGAGRAAGVTADQMDRLAKEAAASADVTVTKARLIAAEYTRLGGIAVKNLPQLTKLTKDYAAATGQDLTVAAKEIAQGLADPARGAELFGDKLGALDNATLRAVRSATGFNDRLRAQKLLMDEVGRATEGAADRAMSKWDRAWDRIVSKPVAAAKEGIGSLVLGPDDTEELVRLRRQRDELERGLRSPIARGRSQESEQADLKNLNDRIAGLERAAAAQAKVAEAGQKTLEVNQKLNAADEVSKTVRPIGPEIKKLEEQAKDLQAGFESANRAAEDLLLAKNFDEDKWSERVKAAATYKADLERVTEQLKEYREAEAAGSVEADKAARALEIKGRYTGQVTAAAQAAQAAELALNDARNTSLSPAERLAAAERARLDVFIGVTRATEEAKRASNDNVESLNAQAKAAQDSGAAYADMARIRAEARVEARGSTEPEEAIVARKIREEEAKLRAELSRKTAEVKTATQVEREANAVARAGGVSEEQRAQRVQINNAIEAERARIMAMNGAAQGELTERLAAYQRQLDASNEVQKEAKAIGLIYDQRQSIELLQLEVSLLGKSTEERNRAVAALKAEQALRKQGIDPQSDLGKQYVDGAKVEASLNSTKERFVDLGKDISSILGGVFDDLFTKSDKGFQGIIDNATKGFAKLGTRLIEQQILGPLLSGKGFDFFGGAANDNAPPNMKPVTDGVEKGAFAGIKKGIEDFISFITGGSSGPLDISNGGAGSGISMKGLGGMGVSALAGFGMGYQSQSPLMGGIGGALGGMAAGAALGTAWGGPVGAAVGAIAGIAGGIMGQQQAKKKRKQEMMALIAQYKEEWEELKPQADIFTRQLGGETVGSLEQNMKDAASQAAETSKAAARGEDVAAQEALNKALDAYNSRTIKEFADGINGMLTSLQNGTGPNSPFNQARAATIALSEQLAAWVADVKYATGESSDASKAAAQAAADYALSTLKTTEPLSVVETRLQEIAGGASALEQALIDLGYSAESAAAAVSEATTEALNQLKEAFEEDLTTKTNSAQGLDYYNEAQALIDEVNQLYADAASLGSSSDSVTEYFAAAAQAIVDSAQLTGDAFDDFIEKYPELAGYVTEYGQELNSVAQAIENASRRLRYQDRLFNALNDPSTLEGQLAAFDRQAARDREAEYQAGGAEIVALEQALAAERIKIITDYYEQVAEKERQALQEAQNFFDTFSRNLREFVDGLRSGSESPLSPEARLAAAQAQYNAQLAMAQGGDRDAVNNLTSYASDLIDAAKAFYASSAGYQNVFDAVTAQLLALPTQVSAEQFIVDAIEDGTEETVDATEVMREYLAGVLRENNPEAIANALSAYFDEIDTSLNGLIDYGELVAALGGTYSSGTLSQIFRELDTNGDGQLSLLELIKYATQDTEANTDQANALQSAANSLQSSANSIAATMSSLLSAISSLNSTQVSTLTALNNQFGLTQSLDLRGYYLNNNMVTALNKIVWNTAYIIKFAASQAGFGANELGVFAEGGWIRGPGTGTSDSVPLLASNGEFIVNAADASRHRRLLEAINGGADIMALPQFAMPVLPSYAMPAPANQNSSAAEARALREEVRALRAELAQVTKAVVAGAQHVRDGVDQGTQAQQDLARETKFGSGRR